MLIWGLVVPHYSALASDRSHLLWILKPNFHMSTTTHSVAFIQNKALFSVLVWFDFFSLNFQGIVNPVFSFSRYLVIFLVSPKLSTKGMLHVWTSQEKIPILETKKIF